MRLNESRKSVSSSLFGWERVEPAGSSAQCVMSCARPPRVILRDNDAFTFFSLTPPFFVSLLQDSKMLNNAASYIFKVWLGYLRMYTGSYCTHSHSQPFLHSWRVRPAVLFAVLPFTFAPAKTTSCIKKKQRIPSQWEITEGTSPPPHITEHWNQYKPEGNRHECTVGTEMCACTKEMSVFRFTQTEVNKSHPKWFLTRVISHSVNSSFSFLSLHLKNTLF